MRWMRTWSIVCFDLEKADGSPFESEPFVLTTPVETAKRVLEEDPDHGKKKKKKLNEQRADAGIGTREEEKGISRFDDYSG